MKVSIIPANELSRDLVDRWSALQQANDSLANPFFCPEFVQHTAAVRPRTEVAVLEDRNGVNGFFAYERNGRHSAQPVGSRMSDFQGMVATPELEVDARQLAKHCRLSRWNFDHVLVSQPAWGPFTWRVADSTFADISNGFEAYRKLRTSMGGDELTQALRKSRKIAREVGPLRLEWHTDDNSVLKALLKWKSEQYLRTGLSDIFSFPWVNELVDRIRTHQSPQFSGVLTALYVGDRLLAAHFGMRSKYVLHYWFPAYEREFQKYSPGLLLLIEIAKAAETVGIRKIDFGKGDEQYKRSFMTGSTQVGEGCVERRAWSLRRSLYHTREWLKKSPLRGPVAASANWTRPLRGWLAMR